MLQFPNCVSIKCSLYQSSFFYFLTSYLSCFSSSDMVSFLSQSGCSSHGGSFSHWTLCICGYSHRSEWAEPPSLLPLPWCHWLLRCQQWVSIWPHARKCECTSVCEAVRHWDQSMNCDLFLSSWLLEHLTIFTEAVCTSPCSSPSVYVPMDVWMQCGESRWGRSERLGVCLFCHSVCHTLHPAGGRNADLTLSVHFRPCSIPVCWRWTVRPAQPHSCIHTSAPLWHFSRACSLLFVS